MTDRHDDSGDSDRQKLHQRVRAHLETLRGAGLAANRSVAIGGSVLPAWLIDDPFARVTSRRWLLLNDGDVWCEAAYVATPWSADQGISYGWLSAPTSALEAVLDLSAGEAQAGAGGLLAKPAPAGSPHRVADRRREPDRRAADEPGRRDGERRSGADRRRGG